MPKSQSKDYNRYPLVESTIASIVKTDSHVNEAWIIELIAKHPGSVRYHSYILSMHPIIDIIGTLEKCIMVDDVTCSNPEIKKIIDNMIKPRLTVARKLLVEAEKVKKLLIAAGLADHYFGLDEDSHLAKEYDYC